MANILDVKYHPRILELRMAGLKRHMTGNFGEERGMRMLKELSEMFNCNWTLLAQIFAKTNKIWNNPLISRERHKQEVILMGAAWGEDRKRVAQKYLGMHSNYLYQNSKLHNPDKFADEDFIITMDGEVEQLGIQAYLLEATNFLASINELKEVLS